MSSTGRGFVYNKFTVAFGGICYNCDDLKGKRKEVPRVIRAQMLYKNYGAVIALSDISFTVESGQIVGVLGRAGCGKTTIANMLTGYLSCDGGSVAICGYDIERHPKRAKSFFGYLPENNPIYPNMSVGEYLRFMARLKRLPGHTRRGEIARVTEMMDLQDVTGQLIARLPRGAMRRVGLAGAVLGDPPILLLDQPTAGLSPADTRQIREIIKKLRRDRTMMIFSNSLSEVAEICHSVLVLNGGKIAVYDSIAQLRHRAGEKSRLKLQMVATPEQIASMAAGMENLLDIDYEPAAESGVMDITLESYVNDDLRPAVWQAAQRMQTPILEMHYMDVSLEDIFLQLTAKSGGMES